MHKGTHNLRIYNTIDQGSITRCAQQFPPKTPSDTRPSTGLGDKSHRYRRGLLQVLQVASFDVHIARREDAPKNRSAFCLRKASFPRGDCCAESCPLSIGLRHRTPSSPIYPSEEIHKPLALSRVFLLSSGGESIILVKKKAPSRSGFSASMHVVLKTRHVNPNIHARRF